MLIYLNIILTLLLGLIIGLNLKRVSFSGGTGSKFGFISNDYNPVDNFDEVQNSLVAESQQCFDVLEKRFIHGILESDGDGLTVSRLNAIINLNNLSAENQRQRRHLFLKELNLKLYLIYGIRETIIRLDSEQDKRIKNYVFSNKLDLEKLMKDLNIKQTI
jgi:hypothetical protein